jgi:hypothetical protein
MRALIAWRSMALVSDETIAARIERLVTEEHDLRKREADEQPEAVEADAARLREIEIELDVCWDLLRQRRALRDAGANPDRAEARDANTVERYWQ